MLLPKYQSSRILSKNKPPISSSNHQTQNRPISSYNSIRTAKYQIQLKMMSLIGGINSPTQKAYQKTGNANRQFKHMKKHTLDINGAKQENINNQKTKFLLMNHKSQTHFNLAKLLEKFSTQTKTISKKQIPKSQSNSAKIISVNLPQSTTAIYSSGLNIKPNSPPKQFIPWKLLQQTSIDYYKSKRGNQQVKANKNISPNLSNHYKSTSPQNIKNVPMIFTASSQSCSSSVSNFQKQEIGKNMKQDNPNLILNNLSIAQWAVNQESCSLMILDIF